jgi:8-oxo-dGTP diphosphatase
MIRYVLGFVFDFGFRNVLLIEKKRPEWMMGRLNGLGGKIEEGESPLEAMRRELAEETRGRLPEVELAPFGRLRVLDESSARLGAEVWLFHGKLLSEMDPRLRALEVDEGVLMVVGREDLSNWNVMPNLRYMVPMALNHLRGLDRAPFFEIEETGLNPEVGG